MRFKREDMYKGCRVFRINYGAGVVVSDVRCHGPSGVTYLLQIKFDNRQDIISMYDDEVDIIHDT